jgi:DNA-binding NtrC family response regulator
MDRPVLMAVDDEPEVLRTVQAELRKRYGTDYDVRCLTSPEEALRDLAALPAAGVVALVLADQWMPGLTGVEFLGRVRMRHPEAKRAVLITWGDRATAVGRGPLVQPLTDGLVEAASGRRTARGGDRLQRGPWCR